MGTVLILVLLWPVTLHGVIRNGGVRRRNQLLPLPIQIIKAVVRLDRLLVWYSCTLWLWLRLHRLVVRLLALLLQPVGVLRVQPSLVALIHPHLTDYLHALADHLGKIKSMRRADATARHGKTVRISWPLRSVDHAAHLARIASL